MSKKRICLKLFTTCMMLSSFTFGGGYVIIPLMKRKFVEDLKWLTEQEVLDITAIAQSSPGSIALNAALLLGHKVAGFFGALFALLGTVLPSLVIVTIISFLYGMIRDNEVIGAILLGMQAGVAALICDISLSVCTSVAKEKNHFLTVLMVVAFVLVLFVKVNVAYIIISCILLGIVLSVAREKLEKRKQAKQVAAESEAIATGEGAANVTAENLEVIKDELEVIEEKIEADKGDGIA